MLFSKFQQLITATRLHHYWPNFTPVAYAIYNDTEVLLANHPTCANAPYITLPKADAFNGCTIILYDNYPTAIVDTRIITSFEEIYAILIHELFHGYQYTYGETRFPNELIGINYTLCEENIILRIEEQAALYNAVQKKDISALNTFLSIRTTRQQRFPQETAYEAAIESVEGPAFYLETKAFKEISNDTNNDYTQKYLDKLINPLESHLSIRKSCYSAGLAICLLLDEYQPSWHHAFTQSKQTLVEFLAGHFNFPETSIPSNDHEQLAQMIMQQDQQLKQNIFQQFEQSKGYKVILKHPFKVSRFDPMNITKLHTQAVHHHFIQLTSDTQCFTFEQPVLTSFAENFMYIEQAVLFCELKPVVTDNTLTIGHTQLSVHSLEEIDGLFYLTLA